MVCVIAAVALAFWSRGAALAMALAGFALWVGAPLWLRRSASNLLESLRARQKSARPVLPPLARKVPPPAPSKKRAENEIVLKRGGGACRALVESPVPPAKDGLADARLRPQNSFRLVADRNAADVGHEKTIAGSEPGEVMDLPSLLENLGKRYRDRQPAWRTPASEPHSDKAPPVTMEMKEIRQRLVAAYGGRLSGTSQPVSPDRPLEHQGSAASRTGSERVEVPPPRRPLPLQPASATRVKEEPAGESSAAHRPACGPDDGPNMTVSSIHFSSQERVAAQVVEGGKLLLKKLPPALPMAPPPRTLPEDDTGMPTAGDCDGNTTDNGFHGEVDRNEVQETLPALQPSRPYTGPGEPDARRETAIRIDPFQREFHDNVFLPPVSLLRPPDSALASMSQDDLLEGGILIEEKLAEFRVKVNVQDAYAGPVITRYEVQPAVGVRGGQVVSLMKDLARALGVVSIRVVETIPGKTCMGLELPNPRRAMIRLSEVLSSHAFQSHASKLALALGKDIIGEPVVADLAKAPHMLLAGTTGSGKSVGVNAMILSLLYRATPDEVRFVMIDPKMLELSMYDGIPHLLAPVVTDMKLAANALSWCVGEMERRYRLMSGLRVRNLAGYNQKVRDALDAGEPLVDPCCSGLDDPVLLSPLPYVVVVVDELADLMMVSGKKIEELIARLAQKARAAGIHLILATQRPSVDVITGLIKANIPTRIAFQVSSKVDSRTILDQMGAECLLGQGDMLYLPPGTGYPQRVHGAFVGDEEVQAVVEHLKQYGDPDYVEGVLDGAADAEFGEVEADRFGGETDPLYDAAVAYVISSRRASISAVQRQLRIGYNRAARLVEQMEASGLVTPMESNGNRTVLVPERQD